jgi:hypothetical protein
VQLVVGSDPCLVPCIASARQIPFTESFRSNISADFAHIVLTANAAAGNTTATRPPRAGLLADAFASLDCRLECSNLFEDVWRCLARRAAGRGRGRGVLPVHQLALKGLVAAAGALLGGEAAPESLMVPPACLFGCAARSDLWHSVIAGEDPVCEARPLALAALPANACYLCSTSSAAEPAARHQDGTASCRWQAARGAAREQTCSRAVLSRYRLVSVQRHSCLARTAGQCCIDAVTRTQPPVATGPHGAACGRAARRAQRGRRHHVTNTTNQVLLCSRRA